MVILAQPHLRAPWSQHAMRKKTLEPKPKVMPLGFKEIAKSLTRGGPPEMGINCPLTVALTDLLAGSTVATLTLTGVCQDQTIGAIYLTTVMTSMRLMNLETPLWQ